MRRRCVNAVMLLVVLLVVSGCATTQSAQKDDSAPRMAGMISVNGRHCH